MKRLGGILLRRLRSALFNETLDRYTYDAFLKFVFYGENKYCSRVLAPSFCFEKIRISLCEQFYYLTKNEYYIATVKQHISNAKELNQLNVDRGNVLRLIASPNEEEIEAICVRYRQGDRKLDGLLDRMNAKIDYILSEKTKPLFESEVGEGRTNDLYADLATLSNYLGFRLPPNIRVMEYIAYINFSTEKIKEDAKQNRSNGFN